MQAMPFFSVPAFILGCCFVWFVVFKLPEVFSSNAERCMWTGKEPLAEVLYRTALVLTWPCEMFLRIIMPPTAIGSPMRIARSRLATCLALQGKFEEAIEIDRADRELASKFGRDMNFAASTGRLARNMAHLEKYLDEADKLGKEAAELAEKCFEGVDKHAEGVQKLVNNLNVSLYAEALFGRADFLSWFERHEEARPLRERALEVINSAFGQTDAMFTTYGAMLGRCYMHLKQYDKAEEFLTKALETRTKQLPADHALLLSGQNAVGKLYCLQGKLVQAEPLLLSASSRLKQWNGDYPEHKADVAQLRSKQGKHTEALALYSDALARAQKLFGQTHPLLLKMLDDYGAACTAAGDAATGKAMHDKAAAIRQKYNIKTTAPAGEPATEASPESSSDPNPESCEPSAL